MRILVVDDELDFGLLLSRFLKRLGHEPVLASDPSEALELLDTEIGGVITDIDMPGMNGVELAQEIRGRMGAIPIAFCTGSDPSGDKAECAARIGPVCPKSDSLDGVRALVDLFVARAEHGADGDR